MADNVTTQSTTLATPPSGTVIATDDVAGVEYQKVKLVDGTADSTTAITGDAANGLDVDVTRVSGVVHVDDNAGSLTVDGTVAATQSGTWTVQPGNTPNTTAWKVDASSVAVPVTDNSGSLTVDAPVGTPVWVRLSDGATAFVGQKAMAASVPVVVASDQTVIPVSDNSGSLTVDGTVTVASTDGVSTLSPKVQNRAGDNVMFTYDPAVTRLLEEVLVELRIANVQRERLLSGTQQADYRADLKLAL